MSASQRLEMRNDETTWIYSGKRGPTYQDAVPVALKCKREPPRYRNHAATEFRQDGTVAMVVALPAGMFPDRKSQATLLLLEHSPVGLPPIAGVVFAGEKEADNDITRLCG